MKNTIGILGTCLLLIFSSCEQKTKPKEGTDSSIPFFNDSLFVTVKNALPSDWTLTNDSMHTLVIATKDSLQFCNFTNAEDYAGDDYKTYIKDKIIDKKPFQIRFTFGDKLTGEQIKQLNVLNNSIEQKLHTIYLRYGIDKLDHKFDSYVAKTVQDSLNIAAFEKEKKEILAARVPVPDFFTKENSVYISNNLPFPNASLCLPEKEKEVEDLIYYLEEILQTK